MDSHANLFWGDVIQLTVRLFSIAWLKDNKENCLSEKITKDKVKICFEI